MASITVKFTEAKRTANAVQYKEDLEDDETRGKIGSIYLLKTVAAELGDPETITVKVSA